MAEVWNMLIEEVPIMDDWPRTQGSSNGDRTLFDPPYEAQRDAASEQRRFSRQCLAILQLLESAGDAGVSNVELASISIKYTARISDLRAAGYTIECFDQDHKTGLARYRLVKHGS